MTRTTPYKNKINVLIVIGYTIKKRISKVKVKV